MGSSQHGFTEEKSCLTKLTAYYEMTSLVDEGRTVDVVYFDFSKAFSSLSHQNPIDKLKYRLHKWTVRWCENWLKWQSMAQGPVKGELPVLCPRV